MSLTVQQILMDANCLVTRLRERDSAADNLISQAQTLNKEIESMRQYQEDLAELNEAARQRPRSALVAGIQQENRHIRELQQENKELRVLLEEHQNTLELIMSKYRQQITKLVLASKSQKVCNHNDVEDVVQTKVDKICEMAAVMSKSVALDDECIVKEQEKLQQVMRENEGLRELLQISQQFGSANNKLFIVETQDQEIQTDSSL